MARRRRWKEGWAQQANIGVMNLGDPPDLLLQCPHALFNGYRHGALLVPFPGPQPSWPTSPGSLPGIAEAPAISDHLHMSTITTYSPHELKQAMKGLKETAGSGTFDAFVMAR